MKPSREEMETIIRIGRMDDTAIISTTDTMYMTKLDKLCESSDEWTCKGVNTCQGDVVEKHYECPKKFISFRSKQTTRTLTDEQRREMAERLKASRNAQDT